MTDEQTAAAIVADSRNACDETAMEAAIVRALQAARKEGGKQVVDEAERVSQILQSANTANADSEAKARFEVDRFAFACAGSVVGSTLTDYQKHALFHQFKNMFDSHESALRQAASTPPPGHIIDDAGVVRKVLGDLPMSIDGMVIGTDARVYWTNGAGYIHDIITQDLLACVNGLRLSPSGLHGSREAAEAAKEGKA